jgi:hypothetical protein
MLFIRSGPAHGDYGHPILALVTSGQRPGPLYTCLLRHRVVRARGPRLQVPSPRYTNAAPPALSPVVSWLRCGRELRRSLETRGTRDDHRGNTLAVLRKVAIDNVCSTFASLLSVEGQFHLSCSTGWHVIDARTSSPSTSGVDRMKANTP